MRTAGLGLLVLLVVGCESTGLRVSPAHTGGQPGGSGGVSMTGGGAGQGGAGGLLGTGGGAVPRLDAGTGDTRDAGTGGNATCDGTRIVASAASNYAFTSRLAFPPIAVSPKSDLLFDWGGVDADMLGRSLDARKELNTISVTMWDLSPSEFEAKMNADALAPSALTFAPPLTVTTDGLGTTARLSTLKMNGIQPNFTTVLPYFDPAFYPPERYTYALMAATGSTVGLETRMIQAFRLDPSSTNTTVTMTKNSITLSYAANLRRLTPIAVPPGQAGIQIDWKSLKTNAMGGTFVPDQITQALVGHYSQSPDELEQRFRDLELVATELYRAPITVGTRVDLSTLRTAAGTPFSGIDGTGTWLVALRCGNCRNPAPWYLSILVPCQPTAEPADGGSGTPTCDEFCRNGLSTACSEALACCESVVDTMDGGSDLAQQCLTVIPTQTDAFCLQLAASYRRTGYCQ